MTDINQELEQIAAEVFVDESDLDEALDTKGDPRAPMKGAAPAQKEDKIAGGTPGGETQDMGPAVVSPDAPSDPFLCIIVKMSWFNISNNNWDNSGLMPLNPFAHVINFNTIAIRVTPGSKGLPTPQA